MNMQLPNIIPFENIELEQKFQEISNQLFKTMESIIVNTHKCL